MAPGAGHIWKEAGLWPPSLSRRDSPAVFSGRAAGAADEVASRAMAAAGLAGLASLPVLLVASIACGAPLAGPAAISLGYLAVANARRDGRPDSARLWSAAVLAGFIAWALALVWTGERPLSAGWLAAALLAPALAALPALARLALQPLPRPSAAPAMSPARALCQSEPPAATSPARPDAAVAARNDGALTSRRLGVTADSRGPAANSKAAALRPCSDLAEAVDFALRRSAMRAAGLAVICDVESQVPVDCSREETRRLLALLLEWASRRAGGGVISVSARRLRGAGLVRVAWGGESGAVQAAQPSELAAARDLVERRGGTLMLEPADGGERVSVRLAAASACGEDDGVRPGGAD